MCLVKEKNYKIVRQVFTLRQRNQEAFYTGLRKPKQMNKKKAMLKKKVKYVQERNLLQFSNIDYFT